MFFFLLVAVFSMVVGVVGLAGLDSVKDAMNDVSGHRINQLNSIDDYHVEVEEALGAMRDIAMATSGEAQATYIKAMQDSFQRMDELSQDLYNDANTDETRRLLQNLIDAQTASSNEFQKISDTVMSTDIEAAAAAFHSEAFQGALGNLRAAMEAFEARIDTMVAKSVSGADSARQMASVWMMAAALFTLCGGATIGVLMSYHISRDMKKLAKAVNAVANGDLTTGVDIDNKNEFGLLAVDVNRMVRDLGDVMRQIDSTAGIVDSASKQVSSSSMSLAQVSTEQASSVEEVSASMAQISEQARQNSDSAGKAMELSNATKGNAAEGARKMHEVLEAMQNIDKSSSSIAGIIKVIDDIAFQTNILALNAAVEAARAGAHGKGFAVVAEEVRNLAARSAKAAGETTSMIEQSLAQVKNGSKIVDQASAALSKIVEGVAETAGLVDSIATASSEQAQGAEQVRVGVDQVSQTIQTTSSVAEEAASSSSELADQAGRLKGLLARFQYETGGERGARGAQETDEAREGRAGRAEGGAEDRAQAAQALIGQNYGKY
jgi:methyl-accepting chemotaxis protein